MFPMNSAQANDPKAKARWIAIVDNRDRYGVIDGIKFRSEIASVRALAESLGISAAAIRNWSHPDRATIGVAMFHKVCEALDITPADVGFRPNMAEIDRKIEILAMVKAMCEPTPEARLKLEPEPGMMFVLSA